MAVDIWPAFDLTKTIRTPRDVLKEQDQLLKAKTKGILGLYIQTLSVSYKGKAGFRYIVNLSCPPLSYSVQMLRVEHGLIDPYPTEVRNEADGLLVVANDEAELVDALRNIVTSRHWTDVSDRVLAISQSNSFS